MSVSALVPLGLLIAAPGPQATAPAAQAPVAAPAPQAPASQPAPTAEPAPAAAPATSTDTPSPDTAAAAAPEQPRHVRHAPGDPLEGFNRAMFSFNTSLDKAIVRPAAMGYKTIVPSPARSGLRNALTNLNEPIVFLNDVLQLKPGNAFRTFSRFLINSVFGLAGLFDVANHEGLPHRKNGFGNTLGRYGVKPGPYLYLPVLGPSSLRDAVGGVGDSAVLPNTVGEPFDRTDYQIGTAVVSGLDARVQYDSEIKTLYDTSLDPYATLRSVYQQSRAADIAAITGKTEASPDDTMEDDLKDPAASQDATPAEAAPAAGAASDATLPEAAPSAGPK